MSKYAIFDYKASCFPPVVKKGNNYENNDETSVDVNGNKIYNDSYKHIFTKRGEYFTDEENVLLPNHITNAILVMCNQRPIPFNKKKGYVDVGSHLYDKLYKFSNDAYITTNLISRELIKTKKAFNSTANARVSWDNLVYSIGDVKTMEIRKFLDNFVPNCSKYSLISIYDDINKYFIKNPNDIKKLSDFIANLLNTNTVKKMYLNYIITDISNPYEKWSDIFNLIKDDYLKGFVDLIPYESHINYEYSIYKKLSAIKPKNSTSLTSMVKYMNLDTESIREYLNTIEFNIDESNNDFKIKLRSGVVESLDDYIKNIIIPNIIQSMITEKFSLSSENLPSNYKFYSRQNTSGIKYKNTYEGRVIVEIDDEIEDLLRRGFRQSEILNDGIFKLVDIYNYFPSSIITSDFYKYSELEKLELPYSKAINLYRKENVERKLLLKEYLLDSEKDEKVKAEYLKEIVKYKANIKKYEEELIDYIK